MTSSNRQSFFERVGITSHSVPSEVSSSQSAPSNPKFEFNFGLDRPETYGSAAVSVERDPTSNDRKLWRSKAAEHAKLPFIAQQDRPLVAKLSPTASGDGEDVQIDQYDQAQHPTLAYALKKIRTYS
jgi:hypothetical protein